MITVTKLTQTCGACPAQWEGETADGRSVYVRYRWGCLRVSFGPTVMDAVRGDDESGDDIAMELGDGFDGTLTMKELREATADKVTWPSDDTLV